MNELFKKHYIFIFNLDIYLTLCLFINVIFAIFILVLYLR